MIKFKRIGYADKIEVTKPDGSSEVISGEGVIDYVSSRYKLGQISEIHICSNMNATSMDVFNIKQSLKCKVVFYHD